jgi:hypothetical protein
VTVVRTTSGWTFGGYAAVPWNSAGNYVDDPNSFIFTINTPTIPSTILNGRGPHSNKCIFGNAGSGPTFGKGHDFTIPLNGSGNGCSSNLGHSFMAPGSTYGGGAQNVLAGGSSFNVTEVEVFAGTAFPWWGAAVGAAAAPVPGAAFGSWPWGMMVGQADQFLGSTILNMAAGHGQLLSMWSGNVMQRWTLLFRGTAHGMSPANFHGNCNVGVPMETMVVIRCTGGHIFGAFSSVGWASRGAYVADPRSFLWTLQNPSGLGPHVFRNKGNGSSGAHSNSVYDHAGSGPTFGGNHDLAVWPGGGACYTNVGNSFALPSGKTGNTVMTGTYNFAVAEIEVYRV